MGIQLSRHRSTEEKFKQIEKDPIAKAIAKQTSIPDDEEIYKQLSTLVTSLNEEKSAKLLWKLSSLLVERSKQRETDPVIQFAYETSSMTMKNALAKLKLVGEELNVDEHLIRHANDSSSAKDLAKAIGKQIRRLTKTATDQITFNRTVNAALLVKYGMAPPLIKHVCMNIPKALSELNIISSAFHSVLCIGFTGHFLYMNPELIDVLRRFHRGEFKDIRVNIIVSALYHKTVESLADLYKGNFTTAISNDLSVRLVLSSADYLGWAAESIDYAMTHDSVEISTTFLRWANEKTHAIQTIISLAGDMAKVVGEQVVNVAKHAGETIVHVGKHVGEKAIDAAEHIWKLAASNISNQLLRIRNNVFQQIDTMQHSDIVTGSMATNVDFVLPDATTMGAIPNESVPALWFKHRQHKKK